MWMCCFVQFVANFGWVFLVTKMPEYLKQVHQADAQTQGFLQSLPLVAGVLGLLLGGWFTDRLTRSFGPRWGRALAMVTSRSIVCLAFLGCLFVGTSTEATICLALVGLATDLGTPACWAFGQDVGGRHVGSAVGWSNMWGNFGAALSPVVLGTIVRVLIHRASDGRWPFCYARFSTWLQSSRPSVSMRVASFSASDSSTFFCLVCAHLWRWSSMPRPR